MDILLGFIVIHHTGAGHTRATAVRRAGPHARRYFDTDLGSRVRDHQRHRKDCIPYQGIHVPFGAVHGEGTANSHRGCRRSFIQLVLDARSADGDGTEEIRGGKGNSSHRSGLRLRPAFHRHVVQYGVRPASQEGQRCAALNADGCACICRSNVSGIRRRRCIRVCRPAGFSGCARCVGGATFILGGHSVLFQVIRGSPGLISSFPALIGPLGPVIGLVFVCIPFRSGAFLLRGNVGIGLGVVLDHARGDSRANKPARGDTALRAGGRSRPQFSCEGTPGDVPRKLSIFIDFLGGFCLVRSSLRRHTDSTAIICDHGNAVYVIIYNARAEAKCFGACVSVRFRAGGIFYISGVRGSDSSHPGLDIGFIIQRYDAVAVPVAEGYHARNADRTALACILGGILHFHLVACRSCQRLRPRKLHAFSGHDKAVATDVLDAYRSPDAYFVVRFFGAVGSRRTGGSIRGQRYGRSCNLTVLSQKHNGIVLQGVNAHRAGQRKRRGRLFLRRALSAYRVGQDAGFLFGFAFFVAIVVTGVSVTTAFSASTGPRSGTSSSSILFGRRRVFSHACFGIKSYCAARNLGRMSPVGIQKYRSVVLYIADQNGSADFRLGVGQRILHRKLQSVLVLGGGCHQTFSQYVDRTVRPTLDRCSRNNNILSNFNIGVVLVGKDAYACAEAKGRCLLSVVATRIGACHPVLNPLDGACGILGLRVLSACFILIICGILVLRVLGCPTLGIGSIYRCSID